MTAFPSHLQGLPGDLRLRLVGAADADAARACLSDEEEARLAGFAHPDRRRTFALGRFAARSLLAERLGHAAALAPLVVAPGGAPGVAGHALFVSIAHAGRGEEAAAAAAVAERPVGVDLERAAPRHAGLLDRLLTPREAGLPGALDAGEAEAASLVWALKESVLKGLGTGLRRGAKSVVVAPDGPGAARADDGDAPWSVRYARRGPFWLAVAWRD